MRISFERETEPKFLGDLADTWIEDVEYWDEQQLAGFQFQAYIPCDVSQGLPGRARVNVGLLGHHAPRLYRQLNNEWDIEFTLTVGFHRLRIFGERCHKSQSMNYFVDTATLPLWLLRRDIGGYVSLVTARDLISEAAAKGRPSAGGLDAALGYQPLCNRIQELLASLGEYNG